MKVELIKSNKIKHDLAIHCPSEVQANELLYKLHSKGYIWLSDEPLCDESGVIIESEYYVYSSDTCYCVETGLDGKYITYSDLSYFKGLDTRVRPYRLVTYREFMNKKLYKRI